MAGLHQPFEHVNDSGSCKLGFFKAMCFCSILHDAELDVFPVIEVSINHVSITNLLNDGRTSGFGTGDPRYLVEA